MIRFSLVRGLHAVEKPSNLARLRVAGFASGSHSHTPAPASSLSSGKHFFNKSEEKDPLPQSFIEKYQLDDPMKFVPLIAGAFGIGTITGLYHWNEESQLLMLFTVFGLTVYSQFGGAIGKYLDDEIENTLETVNSGQRKKIKFYQEEIKKWEPFVNAEALTKSYVDEKIALLKEVRAAAPLNFQHRKREFMIQKLEKIVRYEAEAQEAIQQAVIDQAIDNVTSKFASDEKLKKQSLAAALNFIQSDDAKKAPLGEVGDLFKSYLQQIKKDPKLVKKLEDKVKDTVDRISHETFASVDEYAELTKKN